jgi:molybdopterin synthase catalytic subunit
MRTGFELTDEPITADTASEVRDPGAGAFVAFEGWVRDENEGLAVQELHYEAYAALAIREGDRILGEALSRFDILHALAVHRVGRLEVGEVAVRVAVSAAHRDAAFAACRYLIDEIKARVPIWKKEVTVEGTAHWVNATHARAPSDDAS